MWPIAVNTVLFPPPHILSVFVSSKILVQLNHEMLEKFVIFPMRLFQMISLNYFSRLLIPSTMKYPWRNHRAIIKQPWNNHTTTTIKQPRRSQAWSSHDAFITQSLRNHYAIITQPKHNHEAYNGCLMFSLNFKFETTSLQWFCSV